MGTNSVSNNGNKRPISDNSGKTNAQKNESYILKNNIDELQSALSGNKKLWEVPVYESTSSIFKNSATQNSSADSGVEKTNQKKTNPKKEADNTKLKSQIAEVIKEDEDRGDSKYTPEQISKIIVETSQKYDVDPLLVASIAKQETHFTQELSGKNGKGMMQLTTISLKDMYLRSDIYGKEIKPLLDKYGSPEKLLKAVKNNISVNVEVGTALFKRKLKDAKGNLTRALQNYNGSSLKVSYAKSIQNHYKEMKK